MHFDNIYIIIIFLLLLDSDSISDGIRQYWKSVVMTKNNKTLLLK